MIIHLVLVGLTLCFFIFAWLKDPGYLPKISKSKNSLSKLLEILKVTKSTNEVCSDCYILKP
jgi:hypothetical protein